MPAKIRLARHGKKKNPLYHIVIADVRSPRDGKYIEQIGTYDPITNPATIEVDFEKALKWLNDGAVPTNTCRAILSYTGVYMKKHLLEGVKKGAFDETVAETRFNEWKEQKLKKIQDKKNKLLKESESDLKARLEAEVKVKDARAEAIAKKLAQATAKEKEAQEAAKASEEATKVTEEIKTKVTDVVEEKTTEVAKATEEATKVTEETKTEVTDVVEEKTTEAISTETKPEA